MYDLPALVDHVCQETGYDKVSAPSVPLILPLSCLLSKLIHFYAITSNHYRGSVSYSRPVVSPSPHLKPATSIENALTTGRFHRSFPRKRPRIHLSISINGPIPRKEIISLYSISSSRLCWAFDDWFPIYCVE